MNMDGVMSNGEKDGLAMFYLKGGKLYPVELTQDELDMLNITIPLALKSIQLINAPLEDVNITNLLKGRGELIV